MGQWWETSMSQSAQTMYSDAELMQQVATMPDNMLTSPEEYAKNLKATQAERSGFMATLGNLWGGIDGALSHIPGWGIQKKAYAFMGSTLYAPIDKLVAPASQWLYSEGFSQPFSTLLIQAAKADVNDDFGQLFSGSEWSDAYGKAENISPGQAFMNYENTIAATGDYGLLSSAVGNAEAPDLWSHVVTGKNWKYTGSLAPSERADVKRQQERFLYDNEYWRKHDVQTYKVGSGALDFYFRIFGDPTNLVVGGASNVAKAARSPQFVDDGIGGLTRSYGIGPTQKPITKLPGVNPQSIEEWSTGNATNQFYDWIASPGLTGDTKTAAEIAAHPIWGSGRRVNPFKDQWGQVLANTPREDMPLVLRYSMGDGRAAAELAAKGSRTLDDIGRITENRVLVGSAKLDDEMLSYFATKAETGEAPKTNLLAEPPFPRPTEAGPRQSGWDKRWGPLAQRAALAKEAEAAVVGVRSLGPVGGINAADVAAVKTWQASKVGLIDDELNALVKSNEPIAIMLGPNLGKAPSELTLADSHMFGTMERAYRMGGFSVKTANVSAEAKIYKNAMDRKGRFAVQGFRKGFYGTPIRVIQSFGDRVPEGRVNHNDDDAADRVMDMLKQVPALGGDERLALLNKYMAAPDKVAKSKALNEIQSGIVQHMATRVHGLDPEIAKIIDKMIEVGVGKTMSDLTGGRSIPTGQAFSAAPRAASGMKTADHIKDGEAWIVAPLAKTQLGMTDTLLPIKEINELIARNSGAMKVIHRAGGKAYDNILPFVDSFSTIWKATTLLRPAYVPRMISEEWFASAVKFGAMSRLIADPTMGAKNFIRNRAVQLYAEMGKASHVPTTGAGLESNLAIVRLGDEQIIGQVNARRNDLIEQLKTATGSQKALLEQELAVTKTERIRVNKAMPIVHSRIEMEKELAANLQKDVDKWSKEVAALREKPDQVSALKAETLREKILVAQDEIEEHGHIISEYVDYSDEIMRVALASQGKRLFEGEFEAFGRKIPQAFSKEWDHTISRESLSSDQAYQTMYARGEAVDMARAIKTGSWSFITPDQPNHMAAWQRAINLQFRQDDVFRLVAEDPTGKKAALWLRSPEGKHHLKDLGGYRSPSDLISDVKLTLDKYLPVESLQQKLGRGEEIPESEILANIPKSEFPIVHGEEVKYATRFGHKDTAASKVDRIVAAGFKRLGSIPSDLMSRHPVYARMFEARMRTIMDQELRFKVANGKGDSLSPAELNSMQAKADKLARKDIGQVVYDPKRTTGGEALRFVFPFLNAHADSLSRWGGLIGEKPSSLGTLAKIYNAPVAANMITDDQGNVVDMDGYVTKAKIGPDGKEIKVREKVTMADRVLHLRNPMLDNSKGSIPIKLSAINTIMPGDPWFNPGSGPLVQIAGSQIAKASPQTGDFLQWAKILPYGPSDTSTAITPKYLRAAWDAWKGEDPDNEEYQKAYLATYNRKVAEYHETGKKFTPKDVENDAKNFLYLSFLEAWASPGQTKASPITGTKYQFFVDAYAQLREADPQNAKDIFMQRYGADYFGFTASMSKSMGIAATHSADKMATKYKDLLDLDPDMAPFIIGNIYNGGAFSRSVYAKQLEQSFGSEWVREKITAKNAIEQSQTEQGWTQYRQVKGVLDSMLLRTGFSSYSQSGAEGLNEMRANLVANLSQQFPAWGDAFMTTDRAKIPNRINSFERLVMDERFQQDPMRQGEIAQLQKYLLLRRQFKAELTNRGAKQLSMDPSGNPVGENADLGEAWESNVMKMVNDDTGFASLYTRYLSNDNLQ